MLIIACVKQGTRYPASHVNILKDMVCRNLPDTVEGRFVCFTDDPTGLDEQIETIALPPDLEGWWAKLFMFKDGHLSDGDRIVYFDLDTVIIGALDDLVAYDGPFAAVADFYRSIGDSNAIQSCVMSWPANTLGHVWDRWLAYGRPVMPGGDQEWLERCVENPCFLQLILPGQLVSYKLHCAGRLPPHNARIVNFHGEPKPENCPDEWVRQIWRVGGGTLADIELCFNIEQRKIRENIARNVNRRVPWLKAVNQHDGVAVIVGGAPSIANLLPEICLRQLSKQRIFALNGACNYLADNGILADHHVLLDARPENIDFLRERPLRETFLASQCDPALFFAAWKPVMWHAHIDRIEDLIPNDAPDHCLIASGSTVGLAAMVIAYALGYRTIHLYGMDSSFADTHHAFPQKANDEDIIIEAHAGGGTFKTTPWMVSQVREFQHVASELANAGCQIHVHGDGLLKHVAQTMSEMQLDFEKRMKCVDGYWFPVADQDGLNVRLEERESFSRIIEHVPGRRVALQAGGNVGVFARMLSERFDRVVTFEPDGDNFACLKRNADAPNVEAIQAALGSENGRIGLTRTAQNGGAHYVSEGEDVPMMRIDDLALDQCDLIALDIEGFELEALKGAERTIARHKPVIAIEDKGLSERYGTPEGGAVSWLSRYGYSVAERVGRDVILRAGVSQ